jgi:phage repressor protein C with HTH and peptisase S24 domain
MERAFQASGNMSPTELGLAIDESPQNITNWSKRGISKGGAIKISKIFGVDSNWVLTGEKAANAKMNNYEKSNATISSMAVEVYEDGDPVPDGYVAIDYYEDVYVSGGNGYLNLEKPSDRKMLFLSI